MAYPFLSYGYCRGLNGIMGLVSLQVLLQQMVHAFGTANTDLTTLCYQHKQNKHFASTQQLLSSHTGCEYWVCVRLLRTCSCFGVGVDKRF